ncbi:MAG: carboxypeptidase regulatory-like domain-containing protein [Anaerolineales bacterium]|nr:carboxypeptidase regulatory-like domain-containing protein [Anaerolineales bacterium]
MKNKNLRLVFLAIILVLTSVMCDLTPTPEPTPAVDYVATLAVIQMTQTAAALLPTHANPSPPTATVTIPSIPPTIIPTQTGSQFGSISGALTYPAETIPPLRVVAFNVQTSDFYFIETAANQNAYRFDKVVPGVYRVVAYARDFDIAGGYTQAVLCGLNASCTDHTLILVQVVAGQEAANINPQDWYAPQGSFPPDPLPKPQALQLTGSISGNLSYPSEGIPPLRVVAFNLSTGQSYSVQTLQNQTTYRIDNLPPGSYYVVAYKLGSNVSAGYSQAVLCGLSVNCTDHSLITVQVVAGQETTQINPGDWYAPPGSFPAAP